MDKTDVPGTIEGMSSEPRISVVIPVRNGETLLLPCVQSVLSQSIPLYECIVVDNGSTDKTAAVVKELQKNHPNLFYVYEARKGRGAARNAGIFKARGDIIAMTDVDCVVPHDWLQKITAPIASKQEAVVIGGEYDLVHNYWSRHTQKMYDYILMDHKVNGEYTPYIDTKNFAIDAKLMKAIPFDARFMAMEDEELIIRLRPEVRFRYLREVKVGHRHTPTMLEVVRSAYSRAYWYAQMYHKFKGARDRHGFMSFAPVSPWRFYTALLPINVHALKVQGLSHLLFFMVYDCSWKAGSAVGYAFVHPTIKDPTRTPQ